MNSFKTYKILLEALSMATMAWGSHTSNGSERLKSSESLLLLKEVFGLSTHEQAIVGRLLRRLTPSYSSVFDVVQQAFLERFHRLVSGLHLNDGEDLVYASASSRFVGVRGVDGKVVWRWTYDQMLPDPEDIRGLQLKVNPRLAMIGSDPRTGRMWLRTEIDPSHVERDLVVYKGNGVFKADMKGLRELNTRPLGAGSRDIAVDFKIITNDGAPTSLILPDWRNHPDESIDDTALYTHHETIAGVRRAASWIRGGKTAIARDDVRDFTQENLRKIADDVIEIAMTLSVSPGAAVVIGGVSPITGNLLWTMLDDYL